MATESNLQKIHVFPSEESYETNKGSIGSNDIALIPDDGNNGALYVTLTSTSGNNGTTDYSSSEIYEAYQNGRAVFLVSNGSLFQLMTPISSDLVAFSQVAITSPSGLQAITYMIMVQGTSATGSSASGFLISGSDGIVQISQGGTGVTSMVRTDYTTNRPRGIILQSTTPSSVPNGCIVGVYE